MLRWAAKDCSGPVAIRYPRGGNGAFTEDLFHADKPVVAHKTGTKATLITYGVMVNNVLEAAQQLSASGIDVTVLRLTQVHPIDPDLLCGALSRNGPVIVVEEAASGAGIKEAVAWAVHETQPQRRVYGMDCGNEFVPHGDLKQLHQLLGLDPESIENKVREVLSNEK